MTQQEVIVGALIALLTSACGAKSDGGAGSDSVLTGDAGGREAAVGSDAPESGDVGNGNSDAASACKELTDSFPCGNLAGHPRHFFCPLDSPNPPSAECVPSGESGTAKDAEPGGGYCCK